MRNEAFHINKTAVNYFLDFSFFASLFGERYCISSPCPDIMWGTAFRRVPLHYTTDLLCQ